MISIRTRYSLAQFLAQQETGVSTTLLAKYGVQHLPVSHINLQMSLNNAICDLDDRILLLVLQEIISTQSCLRKNISPKIVFDERFHDLRQCLLLDGYMIQSNRLLLADPSIADASPMEDDLLVALRNAAPPQCEAIINKINDSNEAFRASPPDYNATLTNARVALETMAVDVAAAVAQEQNCTPTYTPSSWGSVISFLRQSGEITTEEEKGLAGVFSFLSPGAHRPLGIPQEHMARLGRSFALNMCWFLLKNYLTRRGN